MLELMRVLGADKLLTKNIRVPVVVKHIKTLVYVNSERTNIKERGDLADDIIVALRGYVGIFTSF